MAKAKVPVLFLLAAVAVGFVLGSTLTLPVHAESNLRGQLHVFTEILGYVNKFYVEEVDSEELVQGAIRGMLQELDPHSQYVDPEAFSRMSERNSGEYEGIGISFEIREGWITVQSAIEGGPSAHLGIRPGDRIVKIEGETAKDLTSEDVVTRLKGPKGSKVNVTISRPGVDRELDYTIVRDKIPIYSVPYAFMLDDGETGYIRAIRFSATTAKELEDELRRLESLGMKRLVFDLRGNTGGFLNQAIEVADRFISGDQLVVYTKGRIPGSSQHYKSTDVATHPHFPLIVLVNGGSASASEIVAGAIQDHDRGLIVGATTFGKGLVQRQYGLGDGSALLLTVARYYTPSGRLIQRDYKDRDAYLAHSAMAEDDTTLVDDDEEKPVFHTLNERRVVYGGGGITPDVRIRENYEFTDTQTDLEQARTFFNFANEYVSRKLKANEYTEDRFQREFQLPESELSAFTKSVLATEGIGLTEEQIAAEWPYIQRAVKREIAGNLWGLNARQRVLVSEDPIVGAALQYFPDAEAMAKLYVKAEGER